MVKEVEVNDTVETSTPDSKAKEPLENEALKEISGETDDNEPIARLKKVVSASSGENNSRKPGARSANSRSRQSQSSSPRNRNPRYRNNNNSLQNINNAPLPTPDQPKLLINDLTLLIPPDLRNFAIEDGVVCDDIIALTKQEIIFLVLKNHIENKNGVVYAYGSLEILPDGYGFLRSPGNSYLPGNDDIYISPSQIS